MGKRRYIVKWRRQAESIQENGFLTQYKAIAFALKMARAYSKMPAPEVQAIETIGYAIGNVFCKAEEE